MVISPKNLRKSKNALLSIHNTGESEKLYRSGDTMTLRAEFRGDDLPQQAAFKIVGQYTDRTGTAEEFWERNIMIREVGDLNEGTFDVDELPLPTYDCKAVQIKYYACLQFAYEKELEQEQLEFTFVKQYKQYQIPGVIRASNIHIEISNILLRKDDVIMLRIRGQCQRLSYKVVLQMQDKTDSSEWFTLAYAIRGTITCFIPLSAFELQESINFKNIKINCQLVFKEEVGAKEIYQFAHDLVII